MHPDVVERFWAKVSKGPDWVEGGPNCWIWLGNVHMNGQGRFSAGCGQMIYAHRFSWVLHRGLIPPGLWVYHRCSNLLCVRPEHLALAKPFKGLRADQRWVAPKIRRSRGDYQAFLDRKAKRPDKFTRKPRIFKPGDKPWEEP